MFPTERAILERLRPLAAPVTLVAGETVKIEVPVRRIELAIWDSAMAPREDAAARAHAEG